MGAALAISVNLGVVFGYMLCSWLPYHYVPYVSMVITGIFLAIFMWLPESPDYLSHIQKAEESKKAYAFYGNTRVTPAVTADSAETGKDIPGSQQPSKITMEDFKDRAVIKGIVISFVLIIFADTAGIFALTNFITELFDWAQIELDVYVATIALGVIQVLGAVISSIFVDRFGRRMLLILSCIGTGICFYALGFYFYILPHAEYKYLVDQLQWLPVVSACGAVLIAAAGVVTLPFFLIAELLPVKLRGAVTSVSLSISWMFAFLVVQYYHAMIDSLTVAGTVWVYGTSCIIEIFFVYFFLPETKNLTIDEIQQRLRKGL